MTFNPRQSFISLRSNSADHSAGCSHEWIDQTLLVDEDYALDEKRFAVSCVLLRRP